MVYSALEALSICSTGMAVITSVVIICTLITKSVTVKTCDLDIPSDYLDLQKSLFGILRMCARCGCVFQILAWLMFSAKQSGFIEISRLLFYYAISFGIICVLMMVVGIICKVLVGKKFPNALFRNRAVWLFCYSVLYFVLSFFIAG